MLLAQMVETAKQAQDLHPNGLLIIAIIGLCSVVVWLQKSSNSNNRETISQMREHHDALVADTRAERERHIASLEAMQTESVALRMEQVKAMNKMSLMIQECTQALLKNNSIMEEQLKRRDHA